MSRSTVILCLLLPLMTLPKSAWSATKVITQCGKASWYELTGTTANGERAKPDSLSAAHRSLPFGTMVTVRNLRNGKTLTVRINDRGPFVKGRVIDVTREAARRLGFKGRGLTQVEVTAEVPNSFSPKKPFQCGG